MEEDRINLTEQLEEESEAKRVLERQVSSLNMQVRNLMHKSLTKDHLRMYRLFKVANNCFDRARLYNLNYDI